MVAIARTAVLIRTHTGL